MTKNLGFTFYQKLIGYLTKKGVKKKMSIIVNKSLFILSKKYGYKPSYIFFRIFLSLNTFIEARTIKKRGRTMIIPFPIKLNRRIHLILKWYTSSILKATNKLPLYKKIVKATISIFKKKKSKALFLKKTNNKLAFLNRSNLHFRW